MAFLGPGEGSRTQVHRYYEFNNSQCGYGGDDLGAPAKPNEAYYISTGASSVIGCSGIHMLPMYVRVGSWTSQPVRTTYVTTSSLYPLAETELIRAAGEPQPPVGQDRFGLTDTGGLSAGYGLHVLQGSSWNLWTAAGVPGTGSFGDNPPYYVGRNAYSAFVTQRTAP